MSKKNHEKVAFITGAAKRIGAEIAAAFHQAGYLVIIHYRQSSQEAQTQVEKFNSQRKHSASCLFADLDRFSHYEKLIIKCESVFNRLDVLINNASTFFPTTVGETTESHWDTLFNSNLKAPFFLSQAAAPFLAKNKGNIINIIDIHAKKPMKNYSVYSCAKAGLHMLTKSLALELAPVIRVNAIAPGHVIWPENKHAFSEAEKRVVLSETALQKEISPKDIAQTALFLAEQSSITGQMISVDGGRFI